MLNAKRLGDANVHHPRIVNQNINVTCFSQYPFKGYFDGFVAVDIHIHNVNEVAVGLQLGLGSGIFALRVSESSKHLVALTAYEDWVERSKAKGEFSADMSSQFAATYIDAQLSNALSQIARGEDSNNVKQILIVAFLLS